ncbi:hypothetical protein B296_00044854 [Ensete ventricosum]|uniref:Uncharacterized protein n=1 Tax=Ensete ventricosum TaxID=4639 RepID=A0A426WZC8_ENSVE|nr:hypothetical protein B296_00044854 [Ensete ventricosum]
MERIRLLAVEMCDKFNTLLDLERCSGDCIGEESQSNKVHLWGQNKTQVVQQDGVVQRGWWWNLVKYLSRMKGVDIEDGTWNMEHGAEAQSFPWVLHFDGGLILNGAKDEGSFEAHAPYLRDAFDRVTKVIQLAEAKLGSEDLSTGQEDAEAPTLEE